MCEDELEIKVEPVDIPEGTEMARIRDEAIEEHRRGETVPMETLFDEKIQRQIEAFEIGWDLRQFIVGCMDGRDLARFFGRDGHPEWMAVCGEEYQRRTCVTTSLDTGIVTAKAVIKWYLEGGAD
jgi:hypothetical protein